MEREKVLQFNRVFYEVEAETYEQRHPEVLQGNREWWQNAFSTHLFTQEPRIPLHIGDIGCGTGFVADAVRPLLGAADRFLCCDLSVAMLRKAGQKWSNLPVGGMRRVCTEATRLPFANASLDVITANAILHHVQDPWALLVEADRVLKSDGILMIAHEPNRAFFRSALLRIAASCYKLIGLGKEIDDHMHTEINARLQSHKITERDLTKAEILRTVEYHSPVEQARVAVSRNKGFTAHDILAALPGSYELLETREYTTLFIRQQFTKVPWAGSLIRALAKTFDGRGNLLSLIVRKRGSGQG